MKIRLSEQIYPAELAQTLKKDFEGGYEVQIVEDSVDGYWIDFQPGNMRVSEFLNKLFEKAVTERFR